MKDVELLSTRIRVKLPQHLFFYDEFFAMSLRTNSRMIEPAIAGWFTLRRTVFSVISCVTIPYASWKICNFYKRIVGIAN
jgi:hypothetical protein